MTTLCRLAVEQRVKKPKLIMKKITKKKDGEQRESSRRND